MAVSVPIGRHVLRLFVLQLTILLLLLADLLERPDQVRAVQVLFRLPCVVLGRVALPLQEVLDLEIR